jgi:hypothetical protein
VSTPDDFKAAEALLPIDTSGPLPLKTSTTAYLTKEERAHYWRSRDGTFVLKSIPEGDEVSRQAYLQRVASGELAIVPVGETLLTVQEKEQEKQEAIRTALAEAEAADNARRLKESQDKLARDEAKLRAEFDAKRDRLKQSVRA